MARFRIRPDGAGWAVYKNGRRHFQKTYSTKQAAEEAAHRAANRGDSVQAKRLDGTWGPERTKGVRGPEGDVG